MNRCGGCGYSSRKWFGRCPECGGWNTARSSSTSGGAPVVALGGSRPKERVRCGLGELDRVLGGGFVVGQSCLLAGEPGIGKSTLVLQLLDGLAAEGRRCLLVSGEESIEQISLRAARLGIPPDRLRACSTTSLPVVLETIASEEPEVVVVDSIQTIHDPSADSIGGGPAQVAACATALTRHGKEHGSVVVLVGHVTKEGSVAGPKALEHLVDAVFALEGERSGSLRLVRALKNRFGSCEETGVFAMEADGLNGSGRSSAFLLGGRRPGPGSIVYPGLQGTRPMLIELQALVAETRALPRRVAIGTEATATGPLARRPGPARRRADSYSRCLRGRSGRSRCQRTGRGPSSVPCDRVGVARHPGPGRSRCPG